MAKLIYSGIMSLDGYIADESGNFDWAAPDAEVHAFVNDLERSVGTYLYGSRMYEVMVGWETLTAGAHHPDWFTPISADYAAIWRAADKIVYSTSLTRPTSAKTQIVRNFDPKAIRRLKSSESKYISVGGPDLASQAIKAGLVDEYHLFLTPIVVGGGTQFLPNGVSVDLELMDEHRFDNGVVHLHYRTR